MLHSVGTSCNPQTPPSYEEPSDRTLSSRTLRYNLTLLSNPGNCDFYSSCLQQLKLPKIWRRDLVVAILKPNKSLEDRKSYRLIFLSCIPFKVLERQTYCTCVGPSISPPLPL